MEQHNTETETRKAVARLALDTLNGMTDQDRAKAFAEWRSKGIDIDQMLEDLDILATHGWTPEDIHDELKEQS